VPILGARRLTGLTTQQLEKFFATVPLAPKSVSILKGIISTALNDGVKWGYLRQNVAHNASTPRQRRAEVEPVGPDEARAIMAAFAGDNLGPLVTLALGTGLRQGELLALRPEDIELPRGRLNVRHTLQNVNGEHRLLEPKTEKSRRTVPLMELTVAAIEQQLENQRTRKLLEGSNWKNELGLLFTTSSGSPLTGSVVTVRFKAKMAKAGLGARRFHELRHAFATLLLSQGVDMRVIMELMGHTQFSTSLVYTHVVPALHTDAAKRLEDAIG
jgi:integrase